MTTTSVPQGTRPTTRQQRGIRLAEDRLEEIEHLGGGTWSVPSCSGTHAYLVDLKTETCSCQDSIRHGGGCKHIAAAAYAKAKTRACDGCGVRVRRRDLVEVGQEQAEAGHGVLEGERLCRGCARVLGVL